LLFCSDSLLSLVCLILPQFAFEYRYHSLLTNVNISYNKKRSFRKVLDVGIQCSGDLLNPTTEREWF
jgi:hypothetical protein